MLSRTDFEQVHSPADALMASLAAAGLLRHEAGPRAGTRREGSGAVAHAVHQGDRLLRTAHSLLIVHARTHGDLCSLWAGDGPDVVAVLCEPGVIEPSPTTRLPTVGSRLSIGIEAIRLQALAGTANPLPLATQSEPGGWSALFRTALRYPPGTGDDFGSALMASVLPWRPCPMVLMTIDAASTLRASSSIDIRSAREVRHTSLGQCLAWALDAVVK